MPPLDTGSVSHTLRLVDPLNERVEPKSSEHSALGAYLRAVREHRGRSLADVAATTRIRRAYLQALEEGDHSALPSRPFAIGYVRAYAAALELDEDAAVARYKAEAPSNDESLHAPIGVNHDRPERRPLFVGIAAIVVIAVVGWNIAQRAVTSDEPPPPEAPVSNALVADAPAPTGPIALGAPTPAPAEQTTPEPYITPGLSPEALVPTGPVAPPAAVIAPVADRLSPRTFAARGAVHGAPAGPAVAVLQARKPASLVVRSEAGVVHFARQLAAGEAYRAPIGQRLVVDVSDPAAFAVYLNGQLRGVLSAPQTPIDKAVAQLPALPPPPPAATPPASAAAPAQAAPVPAAPRPAAAAPRPQPRAAAPRPAAPAPARVEPAPAAAAPPAAADAPLF